MLPDKMTFVEATEYRNSGNRTGRVEEMVNGENSGVLYPFESFTAPDQIRFEYLESIDGRVRKRWTRWVEIVK
jgi:hypothetical protein